MDKKVCFGRLVFAFSLLDAISEGNFNSLQTALAKLIVATAVPVSMVKAKYSLIDPYIL